MRGQETRGLCSWGPHTSSGGDPWAPSTHPHSNVWAVLLLGSYRAQWEGFYPEALVSRRLSTSVSNLTCLATRRVVWLPLEEKLTGIPVTGKPSQPSVAGLGDGEGEGLEGLVHQPEVRPNLPQSLPALV